MTTLLKIRNEALAETVNSFAVDNLIELITTKTAEMIKEYPCETRFFILLKDKNEANPIADLSYEFDDDSDLVLSANKPKFLKLTTKQLAETLKKNPFFSGLEIEDTTERYVKVEFPF